MEKEAELRRKQLEEKERIDNLYKELVDKKVEQMEEKVKLYIDPNNLEAEIEKMLNERVSYNFCVDARGKRYTDYNVEQILIQKNSKQ